MENFFERKLNNNSNLAPGQEDIDDWEEDLGDEDEELDDNPTDDEQY